MSTLANRLFIGLIALVLCLSAHRSEAVVLDWSTLTWTPGTLNNSYDVDPAKPGNDVTVTVTGDTGQFIPSLTPPNAQTPAITQTFEGGTGAPVSALELRVDYSNTSQAVTVTITFGANYSLGVQNVLFTIFDIDSGSYKDRISSITALSTDGITLIPANITGLGSAVSLGGSGTAQTLDGTAGVADSGPGSGDGNATIGFGSTPIQSITFTYGSGPGAPVDPSTQKIGLFNIDFTAVVPEFNPAIASSVLCLVAIGFLHFKSRQRL
jgi:hypothetical protein